jgi:fatty-acyl-CoA synthase
MGIPDLDAKMTMGQALRRVAENRSDQEALVCGALRLTYGQLQEQVYQVAAGLDRLGVGKGERIATLLRPGVAFITLFFAAAERGAILVPLDPEARSLWIAQALEQTSPALLIAHEPPATEVCQSLPTEAILQVVDALPLACAVDDFVGPPTPIDVVSEDLLAILYTSGTTGIPKGTTHTHRGLVSPVIASLKLRMWWNRRPTPRQFAHMGRALLRYRKRLLQVAGRSQIFLSTVSFHTITGIEVFLQALLMGDKLVIQPCFHPVEALELIQQEGVTVLTAVPMALAVMLRMRDFDRYDLSSLLVCGTGSAPCPPELAQEVQRRFGCALHIGYGATELGGGVAATSLDDPLDLQTKTVGRPMPGVECRVVDEQGSPLPPGPTGELLVRGESTMVGYWNVPELTAQVLDKEGWYSTGDMAVLDKQGYLRIVGRKDDVIIRGGRNIYPGEAERHLATHPGIREAAVVGVPGGLGGEEIWAFVIPEAEASLAPHEVREYCRGALEVYQIPQTVRLVDDFPRSSTGKPQRRQLREWGIKEKKQIT